MVYSLLVPGMAEKSVGNILSNRMVFNPELKDGAKLVRLNEIIMSGMGSGALGCKENVVDLV